MGGPNGTTDYRRPSSQGPDDKPAPTDAVRPSSPRQQYPAGFDGSSRRPARPYMGGPNGTTDYRRPSSQGPDDKPAPTDAVRPSSPRQQYPAGFDGSSRRPARPYM